MLHEREASLGRRVHSHFFIKLVRMGGLAQNEVVVIWLSLTDKLTSASKGLKAHLIMLFSQCL